MSIFLNNNYNLIRSRFLNKKSLDLTVLLCSFVHFLTCWFNNLSFTYSVSTLLMCFFIFFEKFHQNSTPNKIVKKVRKPPTFQPSKPLVSLCPPYLRSLPPPGLAACSQCSSRCCPGTSERCWGPRRRSHVASDCMCRSSKRLPAPQQRPCGGWLSAAPGQ